MKRALTLIEVMIIVTIVALLLAMMIPACQKVRDNEIYKKGQRGETLNAKEQVIFERVAQERMSEQKSTPLAVAPAPKNLPRTFQTIVVGDKTYFLVPKQSYAQEMTVDGKVFWLIPADER